MKKWAMLLLIFSSVAFAQGTGGRACKYGTWDRYTGCVLCGLTAGSGYCTCTLKEPCTNGPGGDVVIFAGSCSPPTYCGAAPELAKKNQALARNQWIFATTLPAQLSEHSTEVAKALTTIQSTLSAEDVDRCSWAAMHILLRNKTNPDEPFVADLKDMGNGYVLTVVKHHGMPLPEDSSKDRDTGKEVGTKWTLHLMEKGWALESTTGDHLNGSY